MNFRLISFSFLLSLFFLHIYPADTETTGFNNLPSVHIPANFPKDFLWGVGSCEFQYSGAENCPNSTWALWEQESKNGKPRILNGQRSKKSCDFWHSYAQDIENAKKDLHINAFRFSIAWDRVQPTKPTPDNPNTFDEAALDHYEELIDTLLNNGIVPMITFHHFNDPEWAKDINCFEEEEIIPLFVDFCEKVFDRFSHKVHFWCTINEPTIYIFQGYVRGVFPPGKNDIALAAKVLKNLMIAHTLVYQRLKAKPNGDQAQIGLVHQYLKFYPYHAWNPLERLPGIFLNHLLNTSVLSFLKEGTFKLYFPLVYNEYYKAPCNKLTDFIGLNYYSRVLLQMQISFSEFMKSGCYPHEVMTDMPYAMYPHGIYEAIADVSSLNVPIYITENGIADAHDNRRATFIYDYLKHVFSAIEDGYDVRGFFYWSLLRNWEWDLGYTMQFGLYDVDLETQERRLCEGSKMYPHIIDSSRTPTPALAP